MASYSYAIRSSSRLLMENYFSYFSTKTYVMGTPKNRLSETVLLSAQDITCINWGVRKKLQFYGEKKPYLNKYFVFDLILYVPVNNLSATLGRVFLGWTIPKLGLMCLAQGHNTVTPVKHSTTEPLRSH